MIFDNDSFDYADFDANETDYIEETEKLESELSTLLPGFFALLKQHRLLTSPMHNCHDDYYEKFFECYLAGNIDVEKIEEQWMRVCFGGPRYAKDLYKGACYRLAQLCSDRAEIYADKQTIIHLHNLLKLTTQAIKEINTMDITSMEDAAINVARTGGMGRRKTYAPARKKLVELLNISAPATGWKTRVEAIRAIQEPLEQFIEENSIHLNRDALFDTVGRWSRNEPEVAAAFERHVNSKRKSPNDRPPEPERE